MGIEPAPVWGTRVIDGAFAAARAVHFAATLLLQGTVVVQFLVVERTLGGKPKPAYGLLGNRAIAAAWLLAIISGLAWLLLLAAELADTTIYEALSNGTTWTLLTHTQFGWTWMARAAGFVLLAIYLPIANRSTGKAAPKTCAVVLTLALTGSLAWSGHGAATAGPLGNLHLAADILHLIAAGVWLGGLLPFAILLAARPDAAAEITHRFSSLATLSVLVLLPTGIVNGWSILPSLAALTGTLYGQVLLAKIALFLLMLAFAAVNRFVLTPQLATVNLSARARTRLIIHSGCETALGLAILVLVGVLGTLTPEPDDHSMHAGSHAARAVLSATL